MALTEEHLQQIMEQQQQELRSIVESFHPNQNQVPPEAAAEAAALGVDSIAVRLPSFWMASPELWFKQVETSFDTRNPKITVDSSKYNQVVQALP